MADLRDCGGDGREVEEDAGADGAAEDFDAEEEFRAEGGADGEGDVVDAAGEG